MKMRAQEFSNAGFTLLEMIGVMAVMAILAATTVPSVLQSIELATVRSEAKTLESLVPHIQRYTSNNTTLLSSSNWTTQLSNYTDLSSNDLLRNKRGRTRIYLMDATTNRAMILSVVSPKTALALPTSLSSANFALVWDTPDNVIPTTVSWSGWNAWNGVRNSEHALVIQRIHLGNELQTFQLTINNAGSGTPQFEVIPLGATSGSRVSLPAGSLPQSVPARTKQRVNLYLNSSATNPMFSYVVSNTPKTFTFNGTNWTAQ
jgi:prepilin-type N-terminal cleavage/methylation domain-containing protein